MFGVVLFEAPEGVLAHPNPVGMLRKACGWYGKYSSHAVATGYAGGPRWVDVSRATDNCVGVLDDGVGFIQKPFSKDDLARCVCDALDDKGRGG